MPAQHYVPILEHVSCSACMGCNQCPMAEILKNMITTQHDNSTKHSFVRPAEHSFARKFSNIEISLISCLLWDL